MADKRESNFDNQKKEFIESIKPATPPTQNMPKKESAGSISIDLEVDSDEAIKNLKKVQREIKKTIQLFKQLEEVSKVNISSGGIEIKGGDFTVYQEPTLALLGEIKDSITKRTGERSKGVRQY